MKKVTTILMVAVCALSGAAQAKPNVLFIAVDEADIHPWNMVIYSDELFYYNNR
jgi:hypothetical protein